MHAALALLSLITLSAAPSDPTVAAWTERFRAIPAVRVVWELDRPVRAASPAGGGSAVFRMTYVMRWPDAMFMEELAVRGPDGRVIAPDATPRPAWGSLIERRAWATPDGNDIVYTLGTGVLSHSARGETLRDAADSYGAHSEWVLARWVGDAPPDQVVTRDIGTGVEVTLEPLRVRLVLTPMEGTVALTSFVKLDPRDEVVQEYTYSDFRNVSGVGPAAHSYTLRSAPSGEIPELRVGPYRLVELAPISAPPDAQFIPAEAPAFVRDRDLGETRDAAGNPAPESTGKVSQPVAWFWWLASVGTGLLVVAGGWWFLRRRGAV